MMKKNYVFVLLIMVINFVNAQIEPTSYRGAFAPAPTAMWTDSWTNWDPNNEPYTDAAVVVNVTADITANTTWTAGKTYKLTGIIYVRNNATLTIQPGVVVKGLYTNTGTALVVTKGAKLNAIGTATSPIVFTSARPAGTRLPGDWGGIILLGKAGFNLNNGINNIEGIVASVNTEYGGGASPDDNDNSGTLKYVRIEFGGYVFSPNNEINGLTFGAVGRGTTIDNVQVSFTGDDSFEWFGGAVNCKHLVAYRGIDDDFDTDNGYKGIVQFALGIRDPQAADNPAISTSEGFESDNNAGGTVSAPGLDNTSAIFTNCTLVGPSFRATLAPSVAVSSGHARVARLRRATEQKIYNSLFLDFKNSFVFVDGTLSVSNANSGKLKFKNNIIAGVIDPTYTGGVNPTSLNSWFNTNGNSIQAGSNGLLVAPYGTSSSSYSGLDYRPGTVAATGADFTDSAILPYVTTVAGSLPIVANKSYCKGDIAPQLTATLTTTGVSLKWYTVATGGTASTVAPTPLTTVVGDKFYWVSQVDAAAVESARVQITVTTNALPTEVVGVIVGTPPANSTSATAVGKNVGTTNAYTYTVPQFVDSTLNYLWTVPLGVNIISGQGTNSIVVDYANVAAGAGTVGTIQVQAVNTSGCKTVAKILTITKALPVAPGAITVYNKNVGNPTPTIAISTFGQYMGTPTALTLTATTSVDAASYQWELPTGVALSVGAATPVTTTVTYTSLPFLSPANTPSTVGTKYWVVTNNTYNVTVNGIPTVITSSTATQKIFGSGAYGATTTQNYAPYGTVITSNLNSILVNFAGVTSPTTTALYFGVKAKNGVGLSTTLNTTNVDVVANAAIPGLFDTSYNEVYTAPIAPSTNATSVITATGTVVKTSKLKKLTAAIPTAPTALKLTDNAISTVTGVVVVSKYIGTTTPLTLTATASASASSYEWELPTGVTQLSGGTSNVITISFAGVPVGTTSLYLGVKAKNAIGVSITNNATLAPATSSTAKLLKVTASVPAVVSAVSGQIVSICGDSSYDYTITPSLLANSYVVTGPVGSIVTSASNTTNTTNVLTTGSLGFTVLYPSNFATLTTKTLSIAAVNGVGTSLTNKIITLSSALPAIGVATGSNGITSFARCGTQTLTVPAVLGGSTYTWLVANGTVIVSGQGTTTVTLDFSAVPTTTTSTLVKVTAASSCGILGTAKSISLASAACPGLVPTIDTMSELKASTEVYPNPASSNFTIELDSSKRGSVVMEIYSFDGIMVTASKSINLEVGKNTVNENISSLKEGIYFVKFINTYTNDVIVKKLIKN